MTAGYQFKALNSDGSYSTTIEDFGDVFVQKELFMQSGMWACGYNNHGQLGDGTTLNKSSPVQVGALTNWKQVADGFYHTAVVKTDGTLWVFGYNGYGELGDGTTLNKSSPVIVGALTNWKQVACGEYHTAAISDGYI